MTIAEFFQQREILPGVVSLYKPYGISSTAVTELYKRWTNEKVGHGGTLDPLAEGQLILGIGKGTKKLTDVLSSDKKYRTTIIVGMSSPSGDIELPIALCSPEEQYVEEGSVKGFFEQLRHGISHPMTAFSAVKMNGKTAYDRTRKGEVLEMKEVTSSIHNYVLHRCDLMDASMLRSTFEERLILLQKNTEVFEKVALTTDFFAKRYRFLLEKWEAAFNQSVQIINETPSWRGLVVEVTVSVPKGTYIRSIAQLLGTAMGKEATVVRLERLCV